MKVMVSIPTYNEEKDLAWVLKEIKKAMDDSGYEYVVQVVDDGSRDSTVRIAKEAGVIVHSGRHLGLMGTFKREIKHFLDSDADIFAHTDADGQYRAEDIVRMLKKIEQGYDLVLGSRFSGKVEGMPLMKRLGNMAFARVFSRMLGSRITDTTTGFRAFTKDVAREIKFVNTFTYTQEQLIRASRQNFKVTEIPIHTRKTRESKLFGNPFEYAIKAWINIFRIYRDYAPLRFFGSIGAVFVSLGVILGIFIAYHVWIYGNAGGIPRVVLSMLLILVGIQIGMFGFLADMKNR